MKNNKWLMASIAGVLVACSVIAWLMFGGKRPVNVNAGHGINVQLNASLKDTLITRDKDGKRLWEFKVAEVENDKAKNLAIMKGIVGTLYRKDGSTLSINADQGSVQLDKSDFALEGNVKAVLSTEGELYADKITWSQSKDIVIGTGKVKLIKGEWEANADRAETTTAFKHIKLKGQAKVKKGGK